MSSPTFETTSSPTETLRRLEALVDGAEKHLALVVPGRVLGQLAEPLQRACDRGVFVLLQHTGDAKFVDADLDGVATIRKVWQPNGEFSAVCLADDDRGILTPPELGRAEEQAEETLLFGHQTLRNMLFATVLGNVWPNGREADVTPPVPLPATYDSFFHAVVDATQHLSERRPIEARIEGWPVGEPRRRVTLDGPVVNVRQSFLTPMTNSFFGENTLVLEDGDDRLTVGGVGAFVEDYEADRVTLSPSD